MKKLFIILLLLIFIISCKTKSVVSQEKVASTRLTAAKIIENHYNNKNDFSTLYIKSKAQYADNKQTQNVTAEIKIKKDEQILISIRFLGITMAKALITPKTVSYYEKINGSYFEGDFSALSLWLGTDLDFDKIQNMLLGQAIDNLKKGEYIESLTEQLYRLDEISNTNKTKKSFFFDTEKFLVKRQEITQSDQERKFEVTYSDNKVYDQVTLPSNVVIDTYQNKGKTEINLDYNTITFNEELSFPYDVPNGYKRIFIK